MSKLYRDLLDAFEEIAIIKGNERLLEMVKEYKAKEYRLDDDDENEEA